MTRLFCCQPNLFPARRNLAHFGAAQPGHPVPMEQVSATSADLAAIHATPPRQRFDSEFYFRVGEGEKNSRSTAAHRGLVEQLFGERGLANAGHAYKQVQPRPNTIESAAQIGKPGFPAG